MADTSVVAGSRLVRAAVDQYPGAEIGAGLETAIGVGGCLARAAAQQQTGQRERGKGKQLQGLR